MEVDQAIYLNFNRMTQEGMDTQHRMVHTCSCKTKYIICNQLSKNHDEYLNQFFHEAIQNRWVLVLMIDDFTKIHTNRRPSEISVNAKSMCTIVVKAFKQLKGIISTIQYFQYSLSRWFKCTSLLGIHNL